MSDSLHTHIVVLEGSPYGTPSTHTFPTAEAATPHIIDRVRATVSPALKERLEKAIADQIVSEDGIKATSATIAGQFAYLRELAKAFGHNISIVMHTDQAHEEDDN